MIIEITKTTDDIMLAFLLKSMDRDRRGLVSVQK